MEHAEAVAADLVAAIILQDIAEQEIPRGIDKVVVKEANDRVGHAMSEIAELPPGKRMQAMMYAASSLYIHDRGRGYGQYRRMGCIHGHFGIQKDHTID